MTNDDLPFGIDPLFPEDDQLGRAIEVTLRQIPPRFDQATVTEPDVIAWCRQLAETAKGNFTRHLSTGPHGKPDTTGAQSLLLIGPFGVGKTWQAFGAMRWLAAERAPVKWRPVSAPRLYSLIRPRPGIDSHAELDQLATVPLLLLDDLGAARETDWTEEILYSVVDARWAADLPTLFTTNLAFRSNNAKARTLQTELSERVFSRLHACQRVTMDGKDRRDPRQGGTP